MFKLSQLTTFAAAGLLVLGMASCKKENKSNNPTPTPPAPAVVDGTYAGGELGTTFNNTQSAYEDPTPATVQAGMTAQFKYGEYFFERTYTQNNEPFNGLGPLHP